MRRSSCGDDTVSSYLEIIMILTDLCIPKERLLPTDQYQAPAYSIWVWKTRIVIFSLYIVNGVTCKWIAEVFPPCRRLFVHRRILLLMVEGDLSSHILSAMICSYSDTLIATATVKKVLSDTQYCSAGIWSEVSVDVPPDSTELNLNPAERDQEFLWSLDSWNNKHQRSIHNDENELQPLKTEPPQQPFWFTNNLHRWKTVSSLSHGFIRLFLTDLQCHGTFSSPTETTISLFRIIRKERNCRYIHKIFHQIDVVQNVNKNLDVI